jgi:nickel transport protein
MPKLKTTLWPVLIALFALLAAVAQPVAAHGTEITYTSEGNTVTVQALFDTGEPMAEAQFTVFAPNDPSAVYFQGIGDSEGRFSFDVDPAVAGAWAVRVRIAGHGEIINVPVGADGTIGAYSASGLSAMVRNILTGVVVVVLGGVAWYFSRSSGKEKKQYAHS